MLNCAPRHKASTAAAVFNTITTIIILFVVAQSATPTIQSSSTKHHLRTSTIMEIASSPTHLSTLQNSSSSCFMALERYGKYTTWREFGFSGNLFGRWRMQPVDGEVNQTTTAVKCPERIEFNMVAVTANIIRETLLGLSFGISHGNDTFQSDIWGMAFQKSFTPMFFEMGARVERQGNNTVSISSQRLLINGNLTNVQPGSFSKIFQNDFLRKKFYGSEMSISFSVRDLMQSYLDLNNGTQMPSLDDLLNSDVESKLQVSILAMKYRSPLIFPLRNSSIYGVTAMFIQKSLLITPDPTLSCPLPGDCLSRQHSALFAYPAIVIITAVFNGLFALFVLILLVVFRNKEPRKSRGFLPYLMFFYILVALYREMMQCFYADDNTLLPIFLVTLNTLGFIFLLYLINTLMFFYKRKVYHEIYMKTKRESGEKFDAEQLDGETPSEITGIDVKDIPTLRWVNSKRVKALIVALVIGFLGAASVTALPVLGVFSNMESISLVIQILIYTTIFLTLLIITVSILIDMAWSWRLLFIKCNWKNYFIRNDTLFYRIELNFHILSIFLFLAMVIARNVAMSKTDDIALMTSPDLGASITIATYVTLILQFFTLFAEIMACGGGFVCLVTLYERTRQISVAISESDRDFITKPTRVSIPFLDMLGEDLAKVFVDREGLELLKQFAKSEFSSETMLFLHDMERVYSLLFLGSTKGQNEMTNTVFRTLIMRDDLSPDKVEKCKMMLLETMYPAYISNGCRMPVNISSTSKFIFEHWLSVPEHQWTVEFLSSQEFISELDSVSLDVIENMHDTFRRFQLSHDYKQHCKKKQQSKVVV